MPVKIVYEQKAIEVKPIQAPKPIEDLNEFKDLREEKQLILNLQKGPSAGIRNDFFKSVNHQSEIVSNFCNVFNILPKPYHQIIEDQEITLEAWKHGEFVRLMQDRGGKPDSILSKL